MFLIGMIITIIILICKNKSLSDENFNLRNKLNNIDNFCPECGYQLNKNIHSYNNIIFDKSINDIEHNQVNNYLYNDDLNNLCKDEKNQYSNKEIKNSLILIIGSILIILSAIVFLTSTWNITANFFKTFIIILMLGVFLAASYIADKVFKLKQTANAFYYIALAYIPILLLSIALFSLFGKYLSLYGLGRYIYLTFASFIVSGIYYYNATKRNNNLIAIFSMIFSLLGISFFGLIFNNNSSYLVIIMLFIYNMILNICYKYKKIYYSNEFHLKVINILTISLSIITITTLLEDLIFRLVIEDIILEILLLINLYYLLVKINKKEKIYNYFYPINIISIFFTLGCVISNDFVVTQLAVIISAIVIYLYEYITMNEVSIISYLETLISLIILYIFTFIGVDVLGNIDFINVIGFKSYIILPIILAINICNYLITNKYKMLQSFSITITIMLIILGIMLEISVINIALVLSYIALILITLELFTNKLDHNFKISFNWIGHITIWIFTLFCCFNDNIKILFSLYMLYTIISYISGIKNNKDYLKINSYIYFNIAISYLSTILNIDKVFIIPFTTITITSFEYLKPNLKTNISNIYIILSFTLSFILLTLNDSIINFISFIILAIIFIIYSYKKNENYIYIPAILLLSYIYSSYILLFNMFNYMYIISIGIILSLISFIYYKGKNCYIILFYIYLFFHSSSLEQYKYIGIILLILGTFISYLKKENKSKDIFKFILYISLFNLYNMIFINDLNLNNITILTVGSYLILLIATTRTILKKYNDSYKVIEYISSTIINLIAISTYTSEMDGIIYVIFLTILVIISYIYKYGPIFLVCLISILLNVFILTRTFWFSIPWWIYILLIGSTLVGFAIYNEIKEKKDNNIKEKIEEIKNNLKL